MNTEPRENFRRILNRTFGQGVSLVEYSIRYYLRFSEVNLSLKNTKKSDVPRNTETSEAAANNQIYFKIGLYSEKFCEFCRKKPILESPFNKITGLKAFNLIIKRLWHRSFCVKFAKSLRTLL